MILSYNNQPIGVFDSGVGGLTVLRALKQRLPHESFIFLGDTARLPYGTKSPQTVQQYAKQATQILLKQGVKMLVVACNTASAMALAALQEEFIEIPVIGVIQPGAIAACNASSSREILVIATESTVQSGAYVNAIQHLLPSSRVIQQSTQLLVAIAEEGWVTGDIPQACAKRYLEKIFIEYPNIDCLVLGCTHFPVLYEAIRKVVPEKVKIVDSASTTAQVVVDELIKRELINRNSINATTQFMVTDAPGRFSRTATGFLGEHLHEQDVILVDII